MHRQWNDLFTKDLDVINNFYRCPEEQILKDLIEKIPLSSDQIEKIHQCAFDLVQKNRQNKPSGISFENFLQTYNLSSKEGLALMCLAEALLRIPDSLTQTALIRDKIGSIEWNQHFFKGNGFLSDVASFGFSVTNQLLQCGFNSSGFLSSFLGTSRHITEPVIRQVVGQFMKFLGHQFVMGETINKAVERSKKKENKDYRYSYDMLGESAKTKEDADRYFEAYWKAIQALSRESISTDVFAQPSISVKLSALHPRYEVAQSHRVLKELLPKIHDLTVAAKNAGIALTIDAEESERLLLSLHLVKTIAHSKDIKGWDGFGLAVQAYQRRSSAVIDWISEIAKSSNHRFCVRLVKGAYWDSEIKKTQERGLNDYPVFTRKTYTDISYLACAQKMLASTDQIYPQFATHNAHTVASIIELAGSNTFEFQKLHGMGDVLYQHVRELGHSCRVYAPVGIHRDLLAYLVRRLLENGANTSFVNQIQDSRIPLTSLIENPIEKAAFYQFTSHPKIPRPKDMLMPQRQNSKSIDLSNQLAIRDLYEKIELFKKKYPLRIEPLIALPSSSQQIRHAVQMNSPSDKSFSIGTVYQATEEDIRMALSGAEKAYDSWEKKPVHDRACLLEKLADSLENRMDDFIAILIHESGKTIIDALAEVREAVDFCRYYAEQARHHMSNPLSLPGPTGEINELYLRGRGIFVCISPWNFPLAIFLGQVTAALAAGNCVLAKPAQQTCIVAYMICQLAHECGIPIPVLQYVPAPGRIIGEHLLTDSRVSGVAFTGSTQVAQSINQTLSQRPTAIASFIAETGGINAMIVDSSALLEQVVNDVIISAFQSAGQRCSALRLLFLQEDIVDRTLEMLVGAMKELRVGDPEDMATDIGPVIDFAAHKTVQKQIDFLSRKAKKIYDCSLMDCPSFGSFMAPQLWELETAEDLTEEIFGPILCVVRYKAGTIPDVMQQINAKGYGLTLGVHSRIDETIQYVRNHACVGNLYVNRSMIGAVVGVQPFGGEGLSGTGPKAGGPHYLLRFVVERTFTRDTTAAGGNATLLAGL